MEEQLVERMPRHSNEHCLYPLVFKCNISAFCCMRTQKGDCLKMSNVFSLANREEGEWPGKGSFGRHVFCFTVCLFPFRSTSFFIRVPVSAGLLMIVSQPCGQSVQTTLVHLCL